MLPVEIPSIANPALYCGSVAVAIHPPLEGGTRTSTLRAVTCKDAVAAEDQLDRDALIELSTGHRREERR